MLKTISRTVTYLVLDHPISNPHYLPEEPDAICEWTLAKTYPAGIYCLDRRTYIDERYEDMGPFEFDRIGLVYDRDVSPDLAELDRRIAWTGELLSCDEEDTPRIETLMKYLRPINLDDDVEVHIRSLLHRHDIRGDQIVKVLSTLCQNPSSMTGNFNLNLLEAALITAAPQTDR